MNAQDRVEELEKALDQCLVWAERLQRRIRELENSKTWRAQRAVAEAAGSLSKASKLPAILFEILKGDPDPVGPEPLDPPWPVDKPLLSIVALSKPLAVRSSILPDCEVLEGGLDKAQGRYCAFVTPRTKPSKTWFERAVLALEASPSAAVCYSAELGPHAAPFELDRLERFNPVPAGAVFRRELWDELGGFRLDHPEPERDFWLRAARAGHQGILLGRPATPAPARFRASGRFPRGENFSADKPCILLILPWLAYGGAEQVALQLLEGLREDFSFAVVAVEDDAHLRRAAFEAFTPWVYCLNELGVREPCGFLRDFCQAHNIQAAVVSSTGVGYRVLPSLEGLLRADILHNAAPEGHVSASIERDTDLAMHFAVGGLQRKALESGGIPAEKIVLAPNGVDARGRFDPARWTLGRDETRWKLGLPPDAFVFAYVARLSAEKCPDRFVLAMSLLTRMFSDRKVCGVLAGDGPERLQVEQLIRDEGLRDTVRTMGFTERVPEVLAAADAFVLPSKIEGSPLTLLEAMSMGLPAVAANVGAVAEVVKDDQTGLLVEGGEPGPLADACARLLRDAELGKRLGTASRDLVLREFELERTLSIYREAFLRSLRPTIRQ